MIERLIVIITLFLYVNSCCISICNLNDISLKICGENIDIDFNPIKCGYIFESLFSIQNTTPSNETVLNETVSNETLLNETTNKITITPLKERVHLKILNTTLQINETLNVTLPINITLNEPDTQPDPVDEQIPSIVPKINETTMINGTEKNMDIKSQNLRGTINNYTNSTIKDTRKDTGKDTGKDTSKEEDFMYLLLLLLIPIFIGAVLYPKYKRRRSICPINSIITIV